MTEPFQNEVTVVTGTQKIIVDAVGKVTVVNAGPVGPPGVGGGGGASALADLTDVDVATDPPAVDDFLVWDGTKWTPATVVGDSGGTPGVTSLGALTDVDLTTDPQDTNDVLAWDGTKWTPATLAAAGSGDFAPLGHDHAGVYSPVAHNHDGSYAASAHNHDLAYDPAGAAATAQTAAQGYADSLGAGYASFDHGHVASEVANLGSAALVDIIDEDDMVTNSQFRPPSQQSVKAYVDANAGGTTPVYPTLPIYPTAGLDGNGLDAYGCLPWDSAGNFADIAIAKGQFIGGWCNRHGTINTISFNVMASNLTSGQPIVVLCYGLDPVTGRVTGTPLWEESIPVGTVLGAYFVPTSVPRVLPQNGSCIFVLNSNNNANSVTLKQYQPTGPYNFATATLNARPALMSAMTVYTSGPDLSAWKVGSVAGANVFAATQRMPALELR